MSQMQIDNIKSKWQIPESHESSQESENEEEKIKSNDLGSFKKIDP